MYKLRWNEYTEFNVTVLGPTTINPLIKNCFLPTLCPIKIHTICNDWLVAYPTQGKQAKQFCSLETNDPLYFDLKFLKSLIYRSCSKYFTNLQESKHHLYNGLYLLWELNLEVLNLNPLISITAEQVKSLIIDYSPYIQPQINNCFTSRHGYLKNLTELERARGKCKIRYPKYWTIQQAPP